MVDIGGEVVVQGKNRQNAPWRIGINKPVDDSLAVNQELQTILEISNVGIATSGNYRNFYYKDGKKYAHTIDPRTGYPVQHSILSATVIAEISNVGIATSGNYRNFYYKDGKKYAHTIDPRTGYPVQHSILSATVIARDCMSADAYATAFMVMGLDEAINITEAHHDLDAFFIYSDENGKLQTYHTEGMKKYMP